MPGILAGDVLATEAELASGMRSNWVGDQTSARRRALILTRDGLCNHTLQASGRPCPDPSPSKNTLYVSHSTRYVSYSVNRGQIAPAWCTLTPPRPDPHRRSAVASRADVARPTGGSPAQTAVGELCGIITIPGRVWSDCSVETDRTGSSNAANTSPRSRTTSAPTTAPRSPGSLPSRCATSRSPDSWSNPRRV